MEKDLEKMIGNQEVNKQFLDERMIFLWGEVSDKSAEEIVKKLIFLDTQKKEDIKLLINLTKPKYFIPAFLAIFAHSVGLYRSGLKCSKYFWYSLSGIRSLFFTHSWRAAAA